MGRGSDILAYTVTYGDRSHIKDCIRKMRATAGCWFDWAVFAGDVGPEVKEILEEQLNDPEGKGIQYLKVWPENRGQHHGTKDAFDLARKAGYKWIIRIDDDVLPKTKRWLAILVDYLERLKECTNDQHFRLVGGPKTIGLRYPVQPLWHITRGQDFTAEVVPLLGGACRIHNVEFFSDYSPDLREPLGRGDPQSINGYLQEHDGLFVRFPAIRVVHKTDLLEAKDTPLQNVRRHMGYYYPYIGVKNEPSDQEPGGESADPVGEPAATTSGADGEPSQHGQLGQDDGEAEGSGEVQE